MKTQQGEKQFHICPKPFTIHEGDVRALIDAVEQSPVDGVPAVKILTQGAFIARTIDMLVATYPGLTPIEAREILEEVCSAR